MKPRNLRKKGNHWCSLRNLGAVGAKARPQKETEGSLGGKKNVGKAESF